MSEFVKVAQLCDLPDPGKELFEVEDRLVVVFHVEGQVYCVDDVCTHDGGPLGEGQLENHTIACSRHGAKFDIRDGKALTMPATESTIAHHVKVEDGAVWIQLHDEEGEPVSRATASTPTVGSSSIMSASASAPGAAAEASAETPTNEVTAPAPGIGLTEGHVIEALKKVIDPELFVNIVDLGLIYVVDIQDREDGQKQVAIDMTMTSPACPAGPQLISGAKSAVNQLEEVAEVEVRIVMDPQWTPDKMTDDARDQLGIF